MPLTKAVTALRQGRIIAYPTETVFGLGVDPFCGTALEALLRLKRRHSAKGVILLVRDVAQLAGLVQPPSAAAQRLMAHFWPGPLTLVLPALPGLSPLLTGGGDHLAVRVSSSPRVAALLRAWGGPLVSTSANPSGGEPARDAAGVRSLWPEEVAVVLPGRCAALQLPSTVVRVGEGGVTLLRPGAIPLATIQTL
ncbi:MAG: threonylcarbamoyl-AMP synthase [Magnetococcales bacterium]|nr:threonylcarbamoyl-AMP synthase [Magnetococcales bacterium]MBF0323384.1 threonylcarbamoyl-AMP synthase [Magnetococcales bacterium]